MTQKYFVAWHPEHGFSFDDFFTDEPEYRAFCSSWHSLGWRYRECEIVFTDDIPQVTNYDKFGKWIKCSERLPEHSTYVLLWNQKEFVQGVGYLGVDKNAFYVDGDAYSIHNTTHWMPLPPIPEEEK